MTNLHDLLTEDAIRLDVEASTWQEAIGAAGALLEATGVADGRYTQAMIDSVVEHGPYIVLTPGFAFAHARPSDAVHRTGLSYVRLAQPVEFGHKTNDPVTLVVALAALDSTTHRQAMAELAKSRPPKELAAEAFHLYERFRPEVPSDERGWGAKGVLDLAKIRALARGK